MANLIELAPYLVGAKIEAGRKGGTFATIKSGGLGLADPKAIEKRMKELGAIWCSVRIRETGWGDNVSIQAIFPWPLEEIKEAIAQFVKVEREKYEAHGRAGKYRIVRGIFGEPNQGQQRWMRKDGVEGLCPGETYGQKALSWRDMRRPGMSFFCATKEEWEKLFEEALKNRFHDFKEVVARARKAIAQLGD